MKNDELITAFFDEVRQSRIDHKQSLEKISDSLNALNETNVLHAERVESLDGTVRASVDALNSMATGYKSQGSMVKFYQLIILLLIFTLIVVAGAERVFQYTSFLRIP